jgi:hypothetical protein
MNTKHVQRPHPQPPDNRDRHSPEGEGRPAAQAAAVNGFGAVRVM